MGKGDKKSKRGKLFKGSYGVRRRKKNDKPVSGRKNKEVAVKDVKEVKEVKEAKEVKDVKEVKEVTAPKAKAAPAKKESKPKKQETT